MPRRRRVLIETDYTYDRKVEAAVMTAFHFFDRHKEWFTIAGGLTAVYWPNDPPPPRRGGRHQLWARKRRDRLIREAVAFTKASGFPIKTAGEVEKAGTACWVVARAIDKILEKNPPDPFSADTVNKIRLAGAPPKQEGVRIWPPQKTEQA